VPESREAERSLAKSRFQFCEHRHVARNNRLFANAKNYIESGTIKKNVRSRNDVAIGTFCKQRCGNSVFRRARFNRFEGNEIENTVCNIPFRLIGLLTDFS